MTDRLEGSAPENPQAKHFFKDVPGKLPEEIATAMHRGAGRILTADRR